MKILSVFVLLTVCITFVHCGGDDPKPDPEPTQREKVTALLTANGGKWQPSGAVGITVDGVDVTSELFENFSITFSETTFTTTGTSPVWLRSDTWTFKNDNADVIIRGQDGKEVSILEISETQLKLKLEWDETTTTSGGRKKSLKGTHEFTLNK
jgi:hypothetical protein